MAITTTSFQGIRKTGGPFFSLGISIPVWPSKCFLSTMMWEPRESFMIFRTLGLPISRMESIQAPAALKTILVGIEYSFPVNLSTAFTAFIDPLWSKSKPFTGKKFRTFAPSFSAVLTRAIFKRASSNSTSMYCTPPFSPTALTSGKRRMTSSTLTHSALPMLLPQQRAE